MKKEQSPGQYQNLDPFQQRPFQRYRIPADFDLVDLHTSATLPYAQQSKYLEQCPCCSKYRRLEQIPFCQASHKLTSLGEEIPLYFYFIKATSIFLIFMIVVKIGDYQFCQILEDNQCQRVYVQITIPSLGHFEIPTGYKRNHVVLSFVEFCIFAIAIVILKICIKVRKYRVKSKTEMDISNRTLKLENLHKQCREQQIKQAFEPYVIEVVFTYKVKALQECLKNINKLLKMRKIELEHKKASSASKTKKSNSQNSLSQIEQINQDLENQKKTLQEIKKALRQQNNRLSIAFIVFSSISEKQQAYEQFHTSFLGTICRKLCFCFSKTAIRGQSTRVKVADSPTDIEWANLQNPYLRTKIRRLSSVAVCVILLMFGLATYYLFTSFRTDESIGGPLIKTGITLVLNWVIMILLQYTTQKIENYESHTTRHLTLVKKLTAFLFINISLSPILGYYLNIRKQDDQAKATALLSQLSFSILLIALGNTFKPIPTWLSFDRLIRAIEKISQKRKGSKSIMTQIQANRAFQPVQFPISTYYALSISSLLMVCFYLNLFQILIVVELIALLILYVVSKWMLLRVCKSPAGLARRINNMAQSLLRLLVLVYWTGKTILFYLMIEEGEGKYQTFWSYMIRNVYSIIQIVIVIACTFFMQYFVSWAAKFYLGKKSEKESSDYLTSLEEENRARDQLLDNNQSTEQMQANRQINNYTNANLHVQLQQQCKKFEKNFHHNVY